MNAGNRESQLVTTFVTLADSMVTDYDVVDLLQLLVDDCIRLFDVAAAGILLVGARGELEVVVSTSESSQLVGLMQLDAGAGPCIEAVATGRTVSVPDVADQLDEWPDFARAAQRAGFAAVHAIPMRLRGSTIGSLNLFRGSTGGLNHPDVVAAQALADVATISILQERALRESDLAREQLQRALDSRVVIEQAKGVLAQTRTVDMDQAFELIRSHARAHRLRLRDVAAAVVAGELRL